jgi:hypothetical protein
MKFIVHGTEIEPTVSFSLVEVNNEMHILATDSYGEGFLVATLSETGLLVNAGVPAHLGLPVDLDGEVIVSFESELEDSGFGDCACCGVHGDEQDEF